MRLRMFLANIGHHRLLAPLVTPPMSILYLAAYLRTRFDLDIRVGESKGKQLHQ